MEKNYWAQDVFKSFKEGAPIFGYFKALRIQLVMFEIFLTVAQYV